MKGSSHRASFVVWRGVWSCSKLEKLTEKSVSTLAAVPACRAQERLWLRSGISDTDDETK